METYFFVFLQVDERKRRLEQHHGEIQTLKVSWLALLNELLASINDKFSTFFAALGCAGEVSLDYEKEVKFICSWNLKGMVGSW